MSIHEKLFEPLYRFTVLTPSEKKWADKYLIESYHIVHTDGFEVCRSTPFSTSSHHYRMIKKVLPKLLGNTSYSIIRRTRLIPSIKNKKVMYIECYGNRNSY